jgi:hypothetical protein
VPLGLRSGETLKDRLGVVEVRGEAVDYDVCACEVGFPSLYVGSCSDDGGYFFSGEQGCLIGRTSLTDDFMSCSDECLRNRQTDESSSSGIQLVSTLISSG